jgi:hypothetical protein
MKKEMEGGKSKSYLQSLTSLSINKEVIMNLKMIPCFKKCILVFPITDIF